jgi:hypothetical protein
MATNIKTIDFEGPETKKKYVVRSEMLQDEITAYSVITEYFKDSATNNQTIMFLMLQRVKTALSIVSIDGVPCKIQTLKDFEEIMKTLMENMQEYRIIEQLFIQMNGNSQEAESFVKNLLKAKVSKMQ